MGQVETKVFHKVPPWEASSALQRTHLERDEVEFLWKNWRRDSRSEDGKLDYQEFLNLIDVIKVGEEEIKTEDDIKTNEEEGQLESEEMVQLFSLLDRDEDGFLEFSDLLAFIFCLK